MTRQDVERLAYRYGNRTKNFPVIIDADDLGLCLLEWSGSYGGHWACRWFVRADFLTVRALELTDGDGK